MVDPIMPTFKKGLISFLKNDFLGCSAVISVKVEDISLGCGTLSSFNKGFLANRIALTVGESDSLVFKDFDTFTSIYLTLRGCETPGSREDKISLIVCGIILNFTNLSAIPIIHISYFRYCSENETLIFG